MIRVFTSKTQQLGKIGEDIAVIWLEKQGFRVIGCNISNTFGEIDIVAQKGGTTYFFEVKAGRHGSWFNPAENLTAAKLRKFLISCGHYALINHLKDYRVQGISVRIPEDRDMSPTIELLDLL